jgi:hypothetical protein
VRKLGTAVLLAMGLAARASAAEEAPTSKAHGYSRYEQQSIDDGLTSLGGALDPAPEGKILESIEVLPLEVFEPRDPAPQFLNHLHTTTKRYVVAREVLVKEGEPYRQVLVDETARNLRGISQLSLVVCVPMKGSTPDRVRLAVITKDVWSLRLNWDVGYGPGGLERLVLQPSETNLAGRHQTVSARLEVLPKTTAVGGRYVVPRLFGTRLLAYADANVIVSRDDGAGEGSFGSASFGQPLYSTRTPWSYGIVGSWRNEIFRRYVNAQVGTFDARATPETDTLPFQYRSRRYTATLSATRSFGWANKNDLSFGAEAVIRRFSIPDSDRYDPVVVAEFRERRVPTTDDRVGPFVQYHAYSTDYVRVLDLETLGLQEDYRMGYDVYLRLYPVATAFGASRDYLGTFAGAQYTVPLSDGLARLGLTSTIEREKDRTSDAQWTGDLRIASPRMSIGRVVSDASVQNRYRNYLNRRSFLGGEGALRGYPSSFFDGKDVITYNLEFRTRPVQMFTMQLGGVVFYDVGDAFDGLQTASAGGLRPKQSTGAGLRILFPQLDRSVFRVDFGVPLAPHGRPPGVAAYSFYVAFGQAFSLSNVSSN